MGEPLSPLPETTSLKWSICRELVRDAKIPFTYDANMWRIKLQKRDLFFKENPIACYIISFWVMEHMCGGYNKIVK